MALNGDNMSYRKIWETKFGKIPENYEIHHIDGNRLNDSLENLMCVSTHEHYLIHMKQGDYMACSIIATRLNLTHEERMAIHKLAMQKRDQTGEKNPMFGRSAIKEKNMKWYNDGMTDSMFVCDQQPNGWKLGRLFMPKYDKTGQNNPMAKTVTVNDKIYSCLKDALNDYPLIPYSSLKSAARIGYSKKYNLRINYV
jgi:hypothetical protein